MDSSRPHQSVDQPPNPESALHHFQAVPHRAAGDKRLKARHHRVLNAICRAVSRDTACSLISQGKIAKVASISRQYVSGIVNDLEKWGYITRIKRGRDKKGNFRTFIYRVHYDEPHPAHDASGDDRDRVITEGDATVSPTEEAESDPSIPDINTFPDKTNPAALDSRKAPHRKDTPDTVSNQFSVSKKPLNKNAQQQAHGTLVEPKSSNEVERQKRAVAQAETFEKSSRNAADQRICDALITAFEPDQLEAAFQVLTPAVYDRAIDAEVKKPGAGVLLAKKEIEQAISTGASKD